MSGDSHSICSKEMEELCLRLYIKDLLVGKEEFKDLEVGMGRKL